MRYAIALIATALLTGCQIADGVNHGTSDGLQKVLNHDYEDRKGDAAQAALSGRYVAPPAQENASAQSQLPAVRSNKRF